MKNYMEGNSLKNYEQRKRWIKDHPNLLSDLPPQCKLIMNLLYNLRTFDNLLSKQNFLHLSNAMLYKYMGLLTELGLIRKNKKGRFNQFSITSKGDRYMIELLHFFKTNQKLKN